MNSKLWIAPILALLLTLGGCFHLVPELGHSSTWKEEVLLHDGRTIMVDRSANRGVNYIRGAGSPPVTDHTLRFKQPGANRFIEWTSEYDKETRSTSFNVLALHVLNDVPYLVAEPNLCLAYNKWGRPNPPYLLFKYDGKAWQRISMAELPAEFKTLNLIVSARERDIDAMSSVRGYVGAADIAKLNGSLTLPQYRSILREAMDGIPGGCTRMIRVDGGWQGLGFFSSRGSREACFEYCRSQSVALEQCPCNELFKEE